MLSDFQLHVVVPETHLELDALRRLVAERTIDRPAEFSVKMV